MHHISLDKPINYANPFLKQTIISELNFQKTNIQLRIKYKYME